MPEGERESRLAQVREYVADVIGCAPEQAAAVTRFADGNRHDVYRVSLVDVAGMGDLVVRVSLDDGPDERDRVEREATVLERLGGVGAPALIDHRRSSPWFTTPVMSMRFVPGHTLDLGSASSSAMERVGSAVATVHALPVGDFAGWFDGSGTVLSYGEHRLQHTLERLAWARDPLPPWVGDAVRRAADVVQSAWGDWREQGSFRLDEPLVLLHGDLASDNVLWSPDPVLIDWEYVRVGDPADEIAYLFDQNGLSAPLREAFWRGYGADTTHELSIAHTVERVAWWEPLTLLGSTLWWVERFVRAAEAAAAVTVDATAPKAPAFYLERVVRRVARLDRLLALGEGGTGQ